LVPAGHEIGTPAPIFRNITDEEMNTWKAKFGGEKEGGGGASAAPSKAKDKKGGKKGASDGGKKDTSDGGTLKAIPSIL
jgi:hypothetical protein